MLEVVILTVLAELLNISNDLLFLELVENALPKELLPPFGLGHFIVRVNVIILISGSLRRNAEHFLNGVLFILVPHVKIAVNVVLTTLPAGGLLVVSLEEVLHVPPLQVKIV